MFLRFYLVYTLLQGKKKECYTEIILPEARIKGKVLGLYMLQGLAFTELPESFIESYEVNRNGLGKVIEISMQSL